MLGFVGLWPGMGLGQVVSCGISGLCHHPRSRNEVITRDAQDGNRHPQPDSRITTSCHNVPSLGGTTSGRSSLRARGRQGRPVIAAAIREELFEWLVSVKASLASTMEVGIPGLLSQAQQQIQGLSERSSGAVEKHVAYYNQAQGLGPVLVQSGHEC